MCGIAGYIGKKEGLPIVLSNLRKLEYRGYDSAGVAYFIKNPNSKIQIPNLEILKAVGKLENLEKMIDWVKAPPFTAVIGHTRWATHGVPNEVNAHPHLDCRGEVIVVHNGIIENYRQLKESLSKKGHRFRSQTDTEVVAHLIEESLKSGRSFQAAMESSLKEIVGAYAFAIIYKKDPHKIYLARLGSPLVVGVGKDEHYIASDPTALAGLVKKVIYLKDGQRGVLSVDGFEIGPARPRIESLDLTPEQAQKGSFPHFMLKEIFEGSEVLTSALRGRLSAKTNSVKLGGLSEVENKLKKIKKLRSSPAGHLIIPDWSVSYFLKSWRTYPRRFFWLQSTVIADIQ